MERAYISGSATTPTASQTSSNWISSITRNGAGDYTVNFTSGVFSGIPICVLLRNGTNGYNRSTIQSAAIFRYATTDSAGTLVDVDNQIICMGPR
jgi:hypothetical protein